MVTVLNTSPVKGSEEKSKGAPTQCTDENPLEGGQYVKVTNSILTSHASPWPCNPHYGLKIRTLEGPWVELTPALKQIQTPAIFPVLAPRYQREDLSVGGIYIGAELDSWREHIAYGDLHTAIVKTLTMGVCVGDGTCQASPSSPAYHLNNLLNLENLFEAIDPIEHVKSFIKKNTVYISLLVLLIQGLKFVAFVSSIFTTLLQEGVQGMMAVLYLLFCGKIARKGRKIHMNQFSKDDMHL